MQPRAQAERYVKTAKGTLRTRDSTQIPTKKSEEAGASSRHTQSRAAYCRIPVIAKESVEQSSALTFQIRGFA